MFLRKPNHDSCVKPMAFETLVQSGKHLWCPNNLMTCQDLTHVAGSQYLVIATCQNVKMIAPESH